VVGSEGIFFRMEFVVPEPIVDCLGDFHETPPGRGFLGICFPGGLVYDIFQIYSIILAS
jgi:hypothetical protein